MLSTNMKYRYVLIAVVLLFGAFSSIPVNASVPDWITDNKTGCKVWNSNPQPNESIEWSGECVDGLADGYGILQWKQNGINTGVSHYTEKNGLILVKGKQETNVSDDDYRFELQTCEEERRFLGRKMSAKIYAFADKNLDFTYNKRVALYIFDKAKQLADKKCTPLKKTHDSNKLFVYIFKNDVNPDEHPGIIIKKPARLDGGDDENILHNDIIIEYENVPVNNEIDLSRIWKKTISKKRIKVKLIREGVIKHVVLSRSTSSRQSYPAIEDLAIAKARIYIEGYSKSNDIKWSKGKTEYKIFPYIQYRQGVSENYKINLKKKNDARIAKEKKERELNRRIEQEKQRKAEDEFKKKAKNNYVNFNKKYKIKHWLEIDDLKVNPFLYEGEIVAIETTFEKMITAQKAIFGDDVIVSGIPKGLFRKQAHLILAGKVLGNEAMKTPFGGEILLPHLKFLGVYFCETWNCRDMAQ